MKRLIFLLYLLSWSCWVTAQSDEATGAPITVVTQSDGTNILLRWAINDYATWQSANSNGYTIKRMLYARDTVLSLAEQLQNRNILEADFRPLSSAEWDALFPGDSTKADVAEQILYSDAWDMSISGDPSFKDAVDAHQMNENRLLFAHLLADQDTTIAQSLGLGFVDHTAKTGHTYVYSITIKDGDPTHAGSAFGEISDPKEQLPAPIDLSIETTDEKITIGWSIEGLESIYTSYDILRAQDGEKFAPINQAPFVFGAEENQDPYAYYTDSVGQNASFQYYIVGRTPFGLHGADSEVISGATLPNRLDFQLYIDSLETPDSNSLFLGWGNLPTAYNESLLGFKLYQSIVVEGPFEPLSDNVLPNTDRSITLTDPPQAAYYILEAEDTNGHIYQSPAKFGQLADIIPPAIPQGLIAKSTEEEIVNVSWEANSEEDLAGYRLYRCLLRGGAFALITDGTIQALEFADDISGTVINDTVFYRIQAYDEVGNASPFSEVLAIPRVDVTPPGKPVLSKAMPTPEGVALGWQYSGSPDAGTHELRRKFANGPDWETLLVIPVEDRDQYNVLESNDQITGTCYIDPGPLERREYQYQMLAIDEDGNASGSEVITVRPYDSGERGSIEGFSIGAECLAQPEGTICKITLSWSYQMDDTVTGFQLHRSRNGSSMRLYKVLPASYFYDNGNIANGPQTLSFEDEQVDEDIRYVYTIMAQHIDGGFSEVSKPLTVVAQ